MHICQSGLTPQTKNGFPFVSNYKAIMSKQNVYTVNATIRKKCGFINKNLRIKEINHDMTILIDNHKKGT